MQRLTYKSAGVDIEKADRFIEKIKPWIKEGRTERFAGLFEFAKDEYQNPVLVSSTDGVGTKLKIAILVNKHDTVGIDLVAMNVNDLLALGAKPLFFLDYISTGKLQSDVLVKVVKGIVEGCKQAGCPLIGGETAEMPGMYRRGDYDLAGFCVGVVEKDKIIDGRDIKVGDRVIGLASNGLHSNGFSLVRKVFSEEEQRQMSKELLRPTRIYVKAVLELIKRFKIKGIAHITGGSFYGKVPPILPKEISVRLFKGSWYAPKIFKSIQTKGRIEEKEMYKTFNMGIGMVLIVEKESVEKIKKDLSKSKLNSWVIGEIIKGNGEVIID